MGKAMAEQGIFAMQGWKQWFFTGYWADHPVDPWWLSDVLYIPFASLSVTLAAKAFALVSSAVLGAVFLLCLFALGVRPRMAALFVFLLFFCHREFSFRLLLGRPFPIMTALTLFLLPVIIRRWWMATFILLLVATLLSHLFLFSFGVVVIGAIWLWAIEERKAALLQIFAAAAGILIGLFLHPGSASYVSYLLFAFLRAPLIGAPDVGNEIRSGFGTGSTLFPLIGFVIMVQVLLWRERLLSQGRGHLLFLDIVALFFVLQFFLWERAIDYAWPIALLTLAASIARTPDIVTHRLASYVPQEFRRARLWLAVIVLLGISSSVPLAVAMVRYNGASSLQPYRDALAVVPSGSRVFNVRWDVFPALVAVRPDLRYAVAFDPMFISVDYPRTFVLLEMAVSRPLSRALDPRSFIDVRLWSHELLAMHPSDFLLFPSAPTQPMVDRFRIAGFKDVSTSSDFAVFDVRER
jgi:hypothetical protein